MHEFLDHRKTGRSIFREQEGTEGAAVAGRGEGKGTAWIPVQRVGIIHKCSQTLPVYLLRLYTHSNKQYSPYSYFLRITVKLLSKRQQQL